MSEREDFVSRWSRRKIEGETAEERALREQVETEVADRAVTETATGEGASQTAALEPLDDVTEPASPVDQIDIDALEYKDDFKVFLQNGVPDRLRRMALRKLWASNPIFDGLDGLNDYDDDFTDAALAVKTLKTAYQAGKGYIDRDAEGEDERLGDVDVAETADDVGSPEDEGDSEADHAANAETGEVAGDGVETPAEDGTSGPRDVS